MKWADLPEAGKLTVWAVGVIVASLTWMFAMFETTAASDQRWAQHNQAITCRTVYELKSQVREYLKRLELDRSLTPQQTEWIKKEIDALNEDIKRLDPNGQC